VSSVVGAGNPPFPARVPASTWLVVGLLGILLFGAGIWQPAWAGVWAGPYVEVAIAAVGGSLLVVGFTYYSRSRPSHRRVRLEDLADGKTVTVLDFRPAGASRRTERRAPGEPPPAPESEVRP